MRYDEDLYLKVKNEAREWLFCNPSVYGVALGPKMVAGELTNDLAIQVYVRQKRPQNELAIEEIIPREIKGIKTDVIEGGCLKETADECDNVFSRCLTGIVTEATTGKAVVITSPSHGLAEADDVTIVGVSGIDNRAWTIEVIDQDHFRLPQVDRTRNPLYSCNPQNATCAKWFKVCKWTRPCCVPNGKVTGATATDPVVVTTDSPHGLCTNDKVMIVDVEGMIEINFREFFVKKVAPDRFELKNIKGTTFTPYQRNGRWFKIGISPTGLIKQATNTNPVRITSPNHGLIDGDRVHIFGVIGMTQISTHHTDNPTTIDTDGPDAFKLRGVDGRTFNPARPDDGVWIRIREDQKHYRPIRGGIRIATHKETRTETATANPQSTNVHVTEEFNFGTLGCLAKVNGSNETVILSNYHVLFATDDENVFQPSHKSSKTNKVAERRTVQGAGPGTQQSPSTIDAAIAKVDGDVKCVPKIVDIGWVMGSVAVALSDICSAPNLNLANPCDQANKDKCGGEENRIGYRVRKRGATTLLTEGIIIGICADFRETTTQVFLMNQMVILPMAGGGRGVFNAKGDSGSAVVNDKNEVVGLLAGNDQNGWGYASPIKDVEAKLNIKVWSMPPATGTSTQVATLEDDLQITVPTPELLTQVVQDLAQSEAGREHMALIQHHYQEVESLIHHNKRVMVIWRRNQGPAIVEEIHRVVQERDTPVPSFINGRSLVDCIENILTALKQSGSARLVSDIARYTPSLLRLGNISYSDFLESLVAPRSA